MTQSFKTIEEAKAYFKHYNFSSWLRDTFEIVVNNNGIKTISFSLQGGVATFSQTNTLGYRRPIKTYGVEDANSLITVIREIIADPYN